VPKRKIGDFGAAGGSVWLVPDVPDVGFGAGVVSPVRASAVSKG